MLPRSPRTGQINPTALRLAAEFKRLRRRCAADSLPDAFYGDATAFVVHVYADHAGKFDPVDDQTVSLRFTDPLRGLVRGNISVEHETVDG